PGHGVYAFLLNPQGHILADLYAYNRGDSLLVDSDRGQLAKLLEVFDHYIIMDDVVVEDVSGMLMAIGLAGPHSRDVLQAAGFEVPDLGPLEFREMTWRQFAVTLVHMENEKREGYEIWVAPENAGQVWDSLLQRGGTAVGNTAFDLYRISLGIPRY